MPGSVSVHVTPGSRQPPLSGSSHNKSRFLAVHTRSYCCTSKDYQREQKPIKKHRRASLHMQSALGLYPPLIGLCRVHLSSFQNAPECLKNSNDLKAKCQIAVQILAFIFIAGIHHISAIVRKENMSHRVTTIRRICQAHQHLTTVLPLLTLCQHSRALFICCDPELLALCMPGWKITDPASALG